MTSKPKHIIVLAGEPSGDLHGANLLHEIRKKDPAIRITGIGGERMLAAGMDLFCHIDRLSVMGITEVVGRIRIIKKVFDDFKSRVKTTSPDLLILIDYPGFNLRAAAFAKQYHIPVLYYITPKVWAWKPSRIKKIKRYVDHAALIFPFETRLFKTEKIPSTFVGHPLLDCYGDHIPDRSDKKEGRQFTLGLLPGSRESEIDALLEPMLKAALVMAKEKKGMTILVSRAGSVNEQRFRAIVARHNRTGCFTIVEGDVLPIFQAADFLVAASGTVTLEAAIFQIPMVIVYRMSAVSYFLARIFVKLDHVGLANIIANEEVIPELLQGKATPENIAKTSLDLMNSRRLASMEKKLLMVKTLLGGGGASRRTAAIALGMLRG
ncbi:MAG: lipid-A-disaccharide synthase [Desulfobacteraceae bacterium]